MFYGRKIIAPVPVSAAHDPRVYKANEWPMWRTISTSFLVLAVAFGYAWIRSCWWFDEFSRKGPASAAGVERRVWIESANSRVQIRWTIAVLVQPVVESEATWERQTGSIVSARSPLPTIVAPKIDAYAAANSRVASPGPGWFPGFHFAASEYQTPGRVVGRNRQAGPVRERVIDIHYWLLIFACITPSIVRVVRARRFSQRLARGFSVVTSDSKPQLAEAQTSDDVGA